AKLQHCRFVIAHVIMNPVCDKTKKCEERKRQYPNNSPSTLKEHIKDCV
ncbi:31737_t:CDS:1, partial [Gigaspora margarita]